MHSSRLKTQTEGSGTVYFPTKIPNGIETSRIDVVTDLGDDIASTSTNIVGVYAPSSTLIHLTSSGDITPGSGANSDFLIVGTSGSSSQAIAPIAAAQGATFTIIRGSDELGGFTMTITPNGSNGLFFRGSDRATVTNNGLLGDSITFSCITTGVWTCTHVIGTWSST